MSIVYLNIFFNPNTFRPATRTYAQMLSCFDKVCSEIKEPIYVSVQADFHPYHNGPEHRYMLKQSGCRVEYIENDPNKAKLMAVVEDGSTYVHGKTSFNELTMFGKSKEMKRFNCQPNFGVVILTK